MAHVYEKKWRSEDVRLKEDADFSSLLLNERVLEGLAKAGFKKPSPIQVAAIPSGRFGKDLMVQAKSGTGKTLVFVIIALEHLKRKLFRPQVLVVVPTREIATQVCSVVKVVGSKFHKLTCNSFIGGLPLFEDQEKAVMTQIAVGTPGRLKQLIQLKALPTNSIRLLVFDEADELLYGNSFKDDIEEIFKSLPDDKQVIATSATFNPKVRKMMSRYLCDPHQVRLNPKELSLLGMVHYAVVVQYCPLAAILYKSKLDVLKKILKSVKFAQCLLFCNGIQRVEVLHKELKRWNFSSAYISSAKGQSDRLKAMEKLKGFKCKVLVSSDLTSRGIDAENVDLVVNFDLAYSTETYMHRVGRAGRYGSVGAAISIIDDGQIGYLRKIEKEAVFRVFKLPDPIPRRIIVDPCAEEYVTDEFNLENAKEEKSMKSDDINCDGFGDNDLVDVHLENIQEKDVSEINIDIGNSTSKNASSEVTTATGVKSHDITKDAVKSEMQLEKEDMNAEALLKNKNVRTLDLNDQTSQTEEGSAKLSKNNSDLLNECGTNEPKNNESSDKSSACDIQENRHNFCVEKQDLECDNIKHNVQLPSDGMYSFGKSLSYQPKDIVRNMKDDPVDCIQENNVTSSDTLNIDTFLKAYKSVKKTEYVKSKISPEKNCFITENSNEKLITIDMIDNLNSQKHDFFYKMLKKFQDNNEECSSPSKSEEGNKEKNNKKSHLVSEEINIIHADLSEKSEISSVIAELPEENKINIVLETLPEKSELKSGYTFSDKPNFESTPQGCENIKQTLKIPTDKGEYQPQIENKLCGLFEDILDQIDSDDSSSDEVSEVPKQSSSIDSKSNSSLSESQSSSSFSDSGSQSSLSDSEEDSDSETESSDDSDSSSSTTALSEDEDAENIYHHNYSRTGRQNPSLVSGSARNHMRNDRIYYHRYFQDPKCACCGKTAKGRKPVCKPMRCSNIPYDRSSYLGNVENTPYNSSSLFGCRGNLCPRVFEAGNERHQSFVDYNVTQPCLPREHSRCHRCSSISRRGKCHNRSGRHIHQRSPVHHHTLNCFLPSEHRCHPNTPDYACRQGHWCEMWYKTFYDQWLFLQSVSN